MNFRKKLNQIVQDAFVERGFDISVAVGTSKRPDLCQFQSNDAFKAAKQYKKNPKEVVDSVVEVLSQDARFSLVEFAPPGFLNLSVSDAFLVESLNEMMQDPHHFVEQVGSGKSVVMDYGGPNVAKPLHVGHLRSAIIGESVKRIARVCGYNVISDVHLGDWGLPLGLVITELEDRGFPEITPELLYDVYPFASAKSKEDEDYLSRARTITTKLQNGDDLYRTMWQQIVDISKLDIAKDYKALNVSFEHWYGESDAHPYIPELMDTLNAKSLIRESDGALVVDVVEESDKAPMPPVIVEKRDGSSIYATTDLATLIQRQKDFNPNKVWYVVDKRQGLHFEQVFRVARKAELMNEDTEFTFLGFGTMNGTDGKPFKTRDGGIMRLSTLLEQAKTSALEKQDDKDEVAAQIIGINAIKFGDLINHPTSDYVFDLDKFLSFEGKTGSYILYNLVRINALIEKLGLDKTIQPIQAISDEYDRNLALKLLDNSESYAQAIADLAPNAVAESAYQIANAIAKFYAVHHIVNEENLETRNNWMNLLKFAQLILAENLDSLGMQTVEKM